MISSTVSSSTRWAWCAPTSTGSTTAGASWERSSCSLSHVQLLDLGSKGDVGPHHPPHLCHSLAHPIASRPSASPHLPPDDGAVLPHHHHDLLRRKLLPERHALLCLSPVWYILIPSLHATREMIPQKKSLIIK